MFTLLQNAAFIGDYDLPKMSRMVLHELATEKWGKRLIVSPNGSLREVDILDFALKKIKGFFGEVDGTKQEWIEAHVINFLESGLMNGWILPTDMSEVKKLAERVGVIFQKERKQSEETEDRHAILRDLVERIGQRTLSLSSETYKASSDLEAFFGDFPERAFDKYCAQHQENSLAAYKEPIVRLQQKARNGWENVKKDLFDVMVSLPEGRSFFNEAILRGDLKLVQQFVAEGIDLNSSYDDLDLPLVVAIKNLELEVVKALIAAGADINIQFKNETPFHHAALHGDRALVKFLMDKGADLHVLDSGKMTPLAYAVIGGDLDVVKLLIEAGSDVDAKNCAMKNPLHLAAQLGHDDIVCFLLEKGVSLESRDSNQSTPLHFAANNGHVNTLRILLEKGADINARNDFRNTPLQLACSKGYVEAARFLIEAGADINLGNTLGYGPLHMAIEKGHVQVVELVLEKGADIYQGSSFTPLMYSHAGRVQNSKKINALIIEKDPEALAHAKEALNRKVIGHIFDLDGEFTITSPSSQSQKISLEFFIYDYFWKKIGKGVMKFSQQSPLIPEKLAHLIVQATEFAPNAHLQTSQTFYERWQQGLPIFCDVGTAHHHIGMLIWNDIIVIQNGADLNYQVIAFDKTCITPDLFEKLFVNLSREGASDDERIRYLKEDFPSLLKTQETDLTKMIQGISIEPQTVGNCVWFNSNALILPFCLLYHFREKLNQKKISMVDAQAIIEEQQLVAAQWKSYYQAYRLQKYLGKATEGQVKYPPDRILVARAFKAGYPYGKEALFQPALLQMWEKVAGLFRHHSPFIERLRFSASHKLRKMYS